MAPSTPQVGAEILVAAGGNVIGGTSSATRTLSANVVSNERRDKDGQSLSPGRASWEVGYDGFVLDGGAEVQAHGSTLEVDTGGGQMQALQDLTSISLSMERSMAARNAMGDDFWARFLPASFSGSVELEGSFRDPAGEPALKAVLDALRAQALLDAKLTYGGASYDLTLGFESQEAEFPTETATQSLSAQIDGVPQRTASAAMDAGLGGLSEALISGSRTPLDVAMTVEREGAAVDGATTETGTAFPSSLDLTLPEDGPAETSGSLQGTGPLVPAQQGVA